MSSSWRPNDVLTFVLAEGGGSALVPITQHTTKSATPFACPYRLIDFVLANCFNSGLRRIYVLTQAVGPTLRKYLDEGRDFFVPAFDEFLITVPAPCNYGNSCYLGTADAVFQNIHLIIENRPKHLVILPGDQIYAVSLSELISAHIQSDAVVTVVGVRRTRRLTPCARIMEIDDLKRIADHVGKGLYPSVITPERRLLDVGIYVFKVDELILALCSDALTNSPHDLRNDIIPRFVEQRRVSGYFLCNPLFRQNCRWQDRAILDAYWDALMELRAQAGWQAQAYASALRCQAMHKGNFTGNSGA